MRTNLVQITPENWSERHGAWILSFCFHVLLVCWFLTHTFDLVIEKPKLAPRPVRLVFAQPASVPEVPVPSETLPPAASVVEIPDLSPAPAEKNPTEGEDRQGRREREIAEILEDYGKYASTQRKAAHEGRRDRNKRLEKIDLGVQAVPFFPEFTEGRIGPVRILDVRVGDPEGVKQVMERYGIHNDEGLIETVRPSFLSSASIGDKVYHATGRTGYYEYFVIPEKAQRQMAWLEQNYMNSHGYTPATARVDRVVFGAVRRIDDQWDLGILEIKVRRFAPLGESSDAAPPE